MRGPGENQSARTIKYRVLDERPDLKSKWCKRRLECGAQEKTHLRGLETGGYKEMLSILADQQEPLVCEREGGEGFAGSRPMRTAVHIT